MASKMETTALNTSYFPGKIVDQRTFNALKPLDDTLRCRICFEYFTNCMITKCSHNYCSVCIRRYMMYKSQCPTCFQEASEPELRNNRLVDEILNLYRRLKGEIGKMSEDEPTCVLETKPESSNKDDTTESKFCLQETLPLETTTDATEPQQVSCPVCYNSIGKERINAHLDECLKLTEEERIQSKRKTLPKLVYHLMSDSEIRKRLKEHGLSSSGNRQALIKRHKNFVVLFNANCDSLTPKPVSDLILEIEKQELEERLSSLQSPSMSQSQRKSDLEDISKKQTAYIKKHHSQYNELIREVQERNIKVKVKKEPCDSEGSQSTTKDEIYSSPEIHFSSDSSEEETKSESSEECFTQDEIKNEPPSPTDSQSQNQVYRVDQIETRIASSEPVSHKKVELSMLRKRKKRQVYKETKGSPKKK